MPAALVGADGSVQVNHAWEPADPPLQLDAFCRTSYTGRHEEMRRGLESVLAGELPRFEAETDTFALTINPLPGGGALIVHDRAQPRNARMLRMAGQFVRMGAWEVDLRTQEVTWSEETFRIHGLPSGAPLAVEKALEFYAPEYRAEVTRQVEACMAGQAALDFEAELITAQQQRIWVRGVGEAVHDASGQVVKIQGAFQDVTDRKQLENSLKASESSFRQLAESIPMMVWTATADGVVDYANRRLFDYTGVSDEAASGSNGWLLTLHPDDRQRCIEVWSECVRSGRPYNIEYRMVEGASGEYRWFRVQAVPYRDADGHFVRWYGTALDIHDIKNLERESRRVAERLTTTLESFTDAFFMLDCEWRMTYMNAQAEKLLRRTREGTLGGNLWELFPEAVGTTFDREYHRAVELNQTAKFEDYYPPLDLWTEVCAYPSSEGLAVYFRDTSERRRAEARIAEQAALIDQARDAIMVRDLDHRITFWSKGAERIYGWTAEQALGQTVDELLKTDIESFARADLEVRQKDEWSGQIQQRSQSGGRLTLDGRWTLLRDPSGEPRAILSIDTDVTQSKQLEQQLLRNQRLESIGTLAGGIAHDLNNVLTPIMLSLEYLQCSAIDEETAEVIEMMGTTARRGADMVRQVLTFARGVEGRRMEIQVAHILKETEQFTRDTFPKHIKIELHQPGQLASLIGDPTQLHQVLVNLCVNARDAMPLGGVLQLSAENVWLDEAKVAANPEAQVGPYLRIQVRDSGTGIPPEVLEKIYDPFFTTKEIGVGTGLGLSTSMAIVKGHGGFIEVSSQPDCGTTFQVFLPTANLERSEAAELPDAKVAQPRGRGQLILVVDDEAGVRQVARRTLETFGYRVVVAADGAEALTCYSQHEEEVAAVLTDVMMPVMDGIAAVGVLRHLKPQLPIIAASGLASPEQELQLEKLGVTHFLPKPYSAQDILQALQQLLG
jgi:two-component system cell cycle sensor histidine kinase/response regulator CckA